MWTAISSRRHTPEQVFVFSGDMDNAEVMLHGTVAYTFRTGGKGQMPWSGRAKLVRVSGGTVRMEFYQVYLDTAAQKPSS
ncbi:hypothetical protein K461DRAFT_281197 [Myriangium duriaei CBS 260.36]|uniref:Uncharacterized protein n=1 Tax=Myriangium duriaei CBS 260.36 TaxID=1168546 RepID=A0A9P4MEG7_9PEZI|nr:hypothetical protein K461DRAFT_281197 [Myriangium duriaei CBS 260.36]